MILHINCNYIGSTLHQIMIENLEKKGYKNKVFVPTYDKYKSVIIPNPYVYVSECFKKWDRVIFDYKQSKILKDIKKHYDFSEIKLLHAYTVFTDGNCARKISKEYGIPYVVAVRNTDVNDFFRLMPHLRRRGINIMLDAEKVFFLSKSYENQVFEKYIPKKYKEEIEKKTVILPNGIDEFWIENAPPNIDNIKINLKNKIKLIYAGRIDKNKNIPTIIKAMQLLRKKGVDITLTVVGKIQDKKEFEYIQKDQYTTYIPAQPKEKLIELYRKHDIFIMPSFTESFGLVYAEAMSQGLPILYSKGQGFDGQFEEGKVGFHVDAYSAESVKQGILDICKSNLVKSDIVIQSHRFSWNQITKVYADIYSKMGVS